MKTISEEQLILGSLIEILKLILAMKRKINHHSLILDKLEAIEKGKTLKFQLQSVYYPSKQFPQPN